MENSTKFATAGGVAALAALGYVHRDRLRSMLMELLPPGLLPSLAPKRPGAASPTNAASHRAARPTVHKALVELLGREPILAELQYGQAVGWHETNYGRGWKGPMVGSNNWGAVQCRPDSTLPCISYEDSYPDNTKYTVSFRKYDSPVDGAKDMLRNIFILRPLTAKTLRNAESTFAASYAMRRERYYGGFCPKATKKFGASSARASFANPDKDEATQACAQEAITAHADLIDRIIAQIAGAMEEPMDMPLGSYDEAADYYRSIRGEFKTSGPALTPPHGVIPAALLEVVW